MTVGKITALYEDEKRCAKAASLNYVDDSIPGYTRIPWGNGFSYRDENGNTIKNKKERERLESLAIPPAWRKVWIAPKKNAHLLVTGHDDKDRKQYIYHPKWVETRQILNFYRLIDIGHNLSSIRRAFRRDLRKEKLSKRIVAAIAVALLDETLMRVGNEAYAQENNTYGLTTLRKEHLKVYGEKITFEFTGKSHKKHQTKIESDALSERLKELRNQADERIFSYIEDQAERVCSAEDINQYLQDLSECKITAKDFRTWGGTVAAFKFLKKNGLKEDHDPQELTKQALDQAAEKLGNTPSVAKEHYVHPDVISLWLEADYDALLKKSSKHDYDYSGIRKDEKQLLRLLELLFKKRDLKLTG